jgi:hypothetical protein
MAPALLHRETPLPQRQIRQGVIGENALPCHNICRVLHGGHSLVNGCF